jgi:cation transport ATPase
MVTVIGDGMSNAPAITKADLGIVTGSSTEYC